MSKEVPVEDVDERIRSGLKAATHGGGSIGPVELSQLIKARHAANQPAVIADERH